MYVYWTFIGQDIRHMSRALKDVRLHDRAARAKLKARAKPYWRLISEGRHLGFRSGNAAGSWIARYREAGSGGDYVTARLGLADDRAPADGETVLNWAQAVEMANAWFAQQANRATRTASVRSVREVVEAYVELHDARATQRAGRKTKSMTYSRMHLYVLSDKHLPPIMLDKLCEADLKKWQRSVVGLKQTTVRRVSADLKAALNAAFAVDRAVLPGDFKTTVSEGLKSATAANDADGAPARENQILDDETIRTLVAASFGVDEDFGRLVMLLASTGARFSQLQRMLVRDVQIEQSRLMVPSSRKGRGRKPGHYRVPVGADVIKALLPVIEGRPDDALLLERWGYRPEGQLRWVRHHRQPWLAASEMKKSWQAATAAAGKVGVIPYALRHSSIVRGLRLGLPIRLVAALHDTSVEMIERHYSRWITEGLDDLVARVIVPIVKAA
jgi:integrase